MRLTNSFPERNLPIPVGFGGDGKDVLDGDFAEFVRVLEEDFILNGG